jgi:hypothetical protein
MTPSQNGPVPGPAPGGGGGNVVSSRDTTLSDEAQQALAAQVRAACAAWFSQAALVQQHEANFGLRLARARTPSEAVYVCGEWMSHRLDSVVAMHHRLLELWLTATSAAAATTTRCDTPEQSENVS